MSREAPWIALSVDWADSDMFADATDGERLAWICLLCEAKRSGRGGRLSFRKSALQRHYDLSERAVSGMVERAQKCGAVQIDGDTLTICNWKVYQHRTWDRDRRDYPDLPETRKMLTTSTITNNHNQEQKENTCAASAAESVSQPKPRARDPIWDTMAEIYYPSGVAKSQFTNLGRIVRDLKQKGATADEIRVRSARIRKFSGEQFDTANGLLNNWDRYAHDPRPAAQTQFVIPTISQTVDEAFRRAEANQR